jgi:multidrug resistance efflux pump
MLNISENSIHKLIKKSEFNSYNVVKRTARNRFPLYFSLVNILIILVALLMPWTQNIQADGYVTTKLPSQKPQAIQSVISGRIEKWYVREGNYVSKGDTIVFITEIKNEYFDPELVQRTQEQLDAKRESIQTYDDKVQALEDQYNALQQSMQLKIRETDNKIIQARNKIEMDSIDLIAYKLNLKIAENQFERVNELNEKGLKTMTELQEKELKLQQMQAKVTVQTNKLLNQRNELLNLQIKLSSIQQEYADKLAKSESEKQSALSAKLEAVGGVAKLRNSLSNYEQRQQFYYITAPQSGYITKTIKKGLGEIIKEGVDIVTIMPSDYELAVEIYVEPLDLPLLRVGEDVRLRFDGWPAIVISGWPEASTGMFTGEIMAIDRFISDNGFYRVLIIPDDSPKDWPEELRVGAGASTYILLKDVPLWYEVWRQLNGFPPDFYQTQQKQNEKIKLKAPINSIK